MSGMVVSVLQQRIPESLCKREERGRGRCHSGDCPPSPHDPSPLEEEERRREALLITPNLPPVPAGEGGDRGDLSVPGAKKEEEEEREGGFCVQNLAVKRHVGWGRKLGQSRWGKLKEEAKLAEAAPAKKGKGTVERGPREKAQLYSSAPSLYLYLLSAVCTVGPPPR